MKPIPGGGRKPSKVTERYQADNQAAARIILADTAKFGGPDSLMVQWARLAMEGYERERRPWGLVA